MTDKQARKPWDSMVPPASCTDKVPSRGIRAESHLSRPYDDGIDGARCLRVMAPSDKEELKTRVEGALSRASACAESKRFDQDLVSELSGLLIEGS